MPVGTLAVVVAAVAVPAAALSGLEFVVPALGAVGGAVVADLLLHVYPPLPPVVLAGLLPALVWAGQLIGLAVTGRLVWPPELWAGVVVLTSLLTGVLTRLWGPRPGCAESDLVARVLNEFPSARSVRRRAATAADGPQPAVRRTVQRGNGSGRSIDNSGCGLRGGSWGG